MRIGLTQRVLYHRGRAYDATEQAWYRYLKQHTLVPIPNRLDQEFANWADELDLLIVTGGDDSALRRSVELKLASEFHLYKKPILELSQLLSKMANGFMKRQERQLNNG